MIATTLCGSHSSQGQKKFQPGPLKNVPYEADETDKVQVWPYLVRIEFIAAIAVMAFVLAWAIAFDAPLEDPAYSTFTPKLAMAPGYFLGLQEMLVFFDPWIAGVLLPGLIIIGLKLSLDEDAEKHYQQPLMLYFSA